MSNGRTSAKRKNDGRFEPGQSGNPGGRPKVDQLFVAACRAHTKQALVALVEALEHPRAAYRLTAAKLLLGYAWGHAKSITNHPEFHELPKTWSDELAVQAAAAVQAALSRHIKEHEQ